MKYCIIILFLGTIIAQDIDLLFEYGNQSFINSRFDDAIDKYEKILERIWNCWCISVHRRIHFQKSVFYQILKY